MIGNVYSIRDIKTAQYKDPFILINHGHANRLFGDLVNSGDPQSDLFKHPEDFELYHLGTFDTETGLYKTHEPTQINLGSSVKR